MLKWWLLAFAFFTIGCIGGCRERGAIDIDPAMVFDPLEETSVAIRFPVLAFIKADPNGFPVDPVERRFIRTLQDSGIKVGFVFNEEDSNWLALVDASDYSTAHEIKKREQQRGIELPKTHTLPK